MDGWLNSSGHRALGPVSGVQCSVRTDRDWADRDQVLQVLATPLSY
jgi:hypothetical protein